MRKCDDQKRAADQGESDPTFSFPIAQSSEQWIADGAAKKQGANSNSRMPRVKPSRILKEQRTQARHGITGKVPHAEKGTGEGEEKP